MSSAFQYIESTSPNREDLQKFVLTQQEARKNIKPLFSEKAAELFLKIIVLSAAVFIGGLLGGVLGSIIPGVGTALAAAIGAGFAFTLALELTEGLKNRQQIAAEKRYLDQLELSSLTPTQKG